MANETKIELTPTYLRKIAKEAVAKHTAIFWETVDQCVQDNVTAIENNMIRIAEKGEYEMSSPINICDPKYTDKINSFLINEFEQEVNRKLREIYMERGFTVPKYQSNYFKISWLK